MANKVSLTRRFVFNETILPSDLICIVVEFSHKLNVFDFADKRKLRDFEIKDWPREKRRDIRVRVSPSHFLGLGKRRQLE